MAVRRDHQAHCEQDLPRLVVACDDQDQIQLRLYEAEEFIGVAKRHFKKEGRIGEFSRYSEFIRWLIYNRHVDGRHSIGALVAGVFLGLWSGSNKPDPKDLSDDFRTTLPTIKTAAVTYYDLFRTFKKNFLRVAHRCSMNFISRSNTNLTWP